MEEGIRARLESRRAAKRRGALRSFGAGLALIFAWLAFQAFRHGRPWAVAEAAAACAAAWAAAAKPEALGVLYGPWMKAVGLLGRINSFLIMAVLYYLMFTPYAWLVRLFSGVTFDDTAPGADSYWHERAGLPPRESYKAQF